MRCQRMSTSWIEPFSAWPMCSAPVTFGGGTAITYASPGFVRVCVGEALALPRLLPASP